MFDYLYEWIQNIAFYMVMVTAVMHVIPNPDYKRYIRFFTGLVLVVMLVTPFLKILGMDGSFRELYHSEEYQRQVRKMEEAARYLDGSSTEGNPPEIIEEDGKEEGEDIRIDIDDIQIER